MSDKKGLYPKYVVLKDGEPIEGEVFVLRPDRDKHAIVAMQAYSKSVKADNPDLAIDIFNWCDRISSGINGDIDRKTRLYENDRVKLKHSEGVYGMVKHIDFFKTQWNERTPYGVEWDEISRECGRTKLYIIHSMSWNTSGSDNKSYRSLMYQQGYGLPCPFDYVRLTPLKLGV